MANRPLGITILAILQLLGALLSIFAGGIVVLAALMLGFGALLAALLSVIIFAVGIFGLIVFYGLWTMKSWAWWLTLILNIITIATTLPAITFSLVISLILVIYLLLPGMKSKFK